MRSWIRIFLPALIVLSGGSAMGRIIRIDHMDSYAVGQYTQSIFMSDLNGDGNLDVLLSGTIEDRVSVLLNAGNGSLVGPTKYTVGVGSYSVAAADLDGDSDNDIAAASNLSNVVSILLNNGDGTFQRQVDYAHTDPRALFMADFDNDYDIDIAVSNVSSKTIAIMKNNGDGTFPEPVSYEAGCYPYYLQGSDFDKDGDIDLAIPLNNCSQVGVFYNSGDGSFAAPVLYGVGAAPKCVAVADIDGDMDDDIISCNEGSRNLTVLRNKDDGTFDTLAVIATAGQPNFLTAYDLDHDGRRDLIAIYFQQDSIQIFQNYGNGVFVSVQKIPSYHPISIYAGDLDNDGSGDLAIGNNQYQLQIYFLDIERLGLNFENMNHVISHTPEVYWTHDDVQPQDSFQVQVGVDDNWDVVEQWDTGIRPGSDMTITYAGNPLTDGATYYARARTHNGTNWLDWLSMSFHMNSVPIPATYFFTPRNDSIIFADSVTLTIMNPTDPEGDSLRYDFYAVNDSTFEPAQPITMENVIAQAGEYTSIKLTGLKKGIRYHWRVRSKDGYEIGAWSPYASFITTEVGLMGEDILHPIEDMAHVKSHTPKFYWLYYDSTVQDSFQVQVGTDDNWDVAEMWDSGVLPGTDTSITYAGLPLMDGASYHARLRFHNGSSWLGWLSKSFRMNSVPSLSAPYYPVNDTIIDTDRVYITCYKSTDIEEDALSYDLYLVRDTTSCTSGGWVRGNCIVGATFVQIQAFQLAIGCRYYWQMRAYDNYEYGPWSPMDSFRVSDTAFHNCCDRPGDATNNGLINVQDITLLIGYLYKQPGKPGPSCFYEGDANADGLLNIRDVTYLINYLYKQPGKPAPICL